MKDLVRRVANRVFRTKSDIAVANFNSWQYLRHNARRLEHLATLQLPIHQCSVLEVGAGIGDHTHFYLDRGCRVVATEGREENFAVLRKRYPNLETHQLDMENPKPLFTDSFDVVHCYGLLYHLTDAAKGIAFLARYCRQLLLVESCVSFGDEDEMYPCKEDATDATQTLSGAGCRPTRRWYYNRLKQHFEHVYLPLTQPWHEEFPIDWTKGSNGAPFSRAIFIATRLALDNPLLAENIPILQRRY